MDKFIEIHLNYSVRDHKKLKDMKENKGLTWEDFFMWTSENIFK